MPVSTSAQPVAVLLRLADKVGHLPLERIEPLVERHHRRLGGGGIVGEARGVGRPALRENLALHLLDLPLEPVDPLLGRWRRLALRDGGGRQRARAPRRPQERSIRRDFT